MMALTSVHEAGLAYKQGNVTSHDFRYSVMYAELLCKPIASLAEVKDRPTTVIYLLAITQRLPAY